MKPPWPMPWPLVIALVRTIDSDASPGRDRLDPRSVLLRRVVFGPHQVGALAGDLLWRHHSGLPAAKIGRPLLEERPDALDVFVGGARLALEIALEVELRVEAVRRRREKARFIRP